MGEPQAVPPWTPSALSRRNPSGSPVGPFRSVTEEPERFPRVGPFRSVTEEPMRFPRGPLPLASEWCLASLGSHNSLGSAKPGLTPAIRLFLLGFDDLLPQGVTRLASR